MVSLPRLHAPHSLAVYIVLPANQKNTRSARDVGLYLCWNGSGPDNTAGASTRYTGYAGTLFILRFEVSTRSVIIRELLASTHADNVLRLEIAYAASVGLVYSTYVFELISLIIIGGS
jgi:hypothetical protein